MDLSERDLLEQAKLADKKIELLQKQITVLETQQKLDEMQKIPEII